MPRAKAPSHEILEAALTGLEAQREKLDEQIAEVRRMLGSRAGRKAQSSSSESKQPARKGRKKRTLSAEARKKIAAAQKKRWAQFRKPEA